MTQTYEQYIRESPRWKHKRLLRLKIDKFRCRTCGLVEEEARLEVHHVTYDNLFHEELDDLITLCAACHKAITAVIRRRRYQDREIDYSYEEQQTKTNPLERSEQDIDFSYEQQKGMNYYVERSPIEIDWSVPVYDAQPQTGKPIRPVDQDFQAAVCEAEQD